MVIPAVVDMRDKVETNPADPRPVTVETKTGVERNPEVWKAVVMPAVVDIRDKVETNPDDPRPLTVDTTTGVERNPAV